MYGREYLDWTDKESAAAAIDEFLAAMPAHERKWALAVLRERFEVRVEYRDSGLSALQDMARASSLRQRQCGQPHLDHVGSSGSVLSNILGGL